MKQTYIIIFFLIYSITTWAQKDNKIRTGDQAINAGINAMDKDVQEFKKAIDYLFAARALDKTKGDEVKYWVDSAFVLITDLKDEAERQRKIAVEQRKIAEEKTAEALRQKKIAEKERAEAVKQRKIAQEQTKIAEEQTKIAIEAKEIAIREKEIADSLRIVAVNALDEAVRQRKRAERLRIEALSTAIAIKSSAMKYSSQDREKGLLALHAYDMQRTVNEDAMSDKRGYLSPEIYTGLHDALVTLKGNNYDEITEEEGGHHGKGRVMSILQADAKTVYSVGSDGKVLRWNIGTWQKNGKPTFEVETIQQNKQRNLAAAYTPSSKKLALGGAFSKVQLVNHSGSSVKSVKIEERNPNYIFGDIEAPEFTHIYSLAFNGDSLFTLSNKTHLQMVNTQTNNVYTIKKLEKKSDQMALHPNGKLLAIGTEEGTVDIYDTKDFSEPKFTLEFKQDDLKGKKITAMAFDEITHQLAIGTDDGHLGLVTPANGIYSTDYTIAKSQHHAMISSIDFATYQRTNNIIDTVMAVGSYDGEVSVWRLPMFSNSLYEPFVFARHNIPESQEAWVTSIKLIESPVNANYKQLMVGYADGIIKFCNLDVSSLADDLQCTIENKFGRSVRLTEDELKKYQLISPDVQIKKVAVCRD